MSLGPSCQWRASAGLRGRVGARVDWCHPARNHPTCNESRTVASGITGAPDQSACPSSWIAGSRLNRCCRCCEANRVVLMPAHSRWCSLTGPPANEVGGAANARRHVASAFPVTPPRLGPGPGEKCGGGGHEWQKGQGWVGGFGGWGAAGWISWCRSCNCSRPGRNEEGSSGGCSVTEGGRRGCRGGGGGGIKRASENQRET